MKNILGFLSLALLLTSCEKGDGYVDTSLPSTGGKVKIVHASHNAPTLLFYGRDTTIKFSAVAPTGTSTLVGTAYAATYPSNGYMLLAPYNDELKFRVPPASTVSPGLFQSLGKINIEEGKNYSVFVIDEFPNLSSFTVNDTLRNFNTILDTTYDARFVNAMVGSPGVDIFSKNENKVIFANIPYKGSTSFMNFRRNSVTPDDEIQVRTAGTSTILAKLAFTPSVKRTYTWFARGKFGATTGTGVPALSFYTNQ